MIYVSWSNDFAFISWRLFDGWTSNFGIMIQCDTTFDLKCRSQWPIFLGPVILSYFLKTLIYMNIVLCYNEPVWHNLWPLNRSHWPLFHGPLILPNILETIWWMLYSFKEAIYNHLIPDSKTDIAFTMRSGKVQKQKYTSSIYKLNMLG